MRTKGALSLNTEEIEKAKNLRAVGLSFRAIGRELHRSAHAIKRLLSTPAVVAEVKAQKADLAEKFKMQSERVLDSICDKDISAASLQQKSISAGVLLDKSRLLAGESTCNVSVSALVDVAKLLRNREGEDSAWREAHARLVAKDGKPCIVDNCPVHSQPSLPAGTEN